MATKKTTKKTAEKKLTKKASSASKRAPNTKWTVVGVSGEEIGTGAYEGKKSLAHVEIAEGVTRIGIRAFAGCVNLVSIRIPKSVMYIGNDAFSGCVKLRDVELADGLETIGCEVFAGCAALPAIVKKGRLFFAPVVKGSVSFPAGVTSIADNAFNRNSDLKRITLPGGVRQIGENAFEFCKNLVSVDIPDSVVEIGAEAFSSCCSLRHVKLPGRLKKLGYGVFSSCKMLTSVELPQSVMDLGSSCFEGCERLKSAAVLAKIKALPYDSFKNCSALASIRMPEVSEIGSSAFKGCESLRSFDFARIREIGYDAFAGCKGLKSISFPSTLRSVDRDAFCGCVSLVCVDASPAVLKKINYASVFKGCPLLPPLIVDGVLKFMPVAGERVVIPEGVTEISDNLFEDCEGLKDVVFPSSLKKIGESSFNATGIEKLDLPSGLLEIGEEAFRYCKALKTLTIPDSVKVIESRAFAACTQLASLKLSESIEEIDDGVFAACKSLKEVAIPAGVKVVRDEAFGFCKVLNRITFNSGDTSVHREAFRQCVVVRKVEVPSGLKKECALLDSRGYQSVKSVADRNAKYGEDVELKTAELRLWSYLPTIGTAWVDSLDEVDDDLAECARDEGGWVHALDVSDIGGELEINGADVGIDFKLVRRVEAGIENTWSEFRNKIGIYSVDIDKSGCSTVFAIAGDFDPKKLTLYYKTAIGPGYYKHPEDVTIDLLDRVEYDGLELELNYDDDSNNKGCMFTVFNKGRYAEYKYGCNVDDLHWKSFPDFGDYVRWKTWSEDEWKRLEGMLAKHNPKIDARMKERYGDCFEEDFEDSDDFLKHACRRNHDWALLVGKWDWGWLIEKVPELAYDERWAEEFDKWLGDNDDDWLTRERLDFWRKVVKERLPLEEVLKHGRLAGNSDDYCVELDDDQGPVEIHFRKWQDWDKARWERLEAFLSTKDPGTTEAFKEDFCYALDYYCNDDEAEMSEVEFLKRFFTQALKRSSVWLAAIPNDLYMACLFVSGISLDVRPDFRKVVVDWCNGNAVEDEYYEDDEDCIDDDGGTLNRWAYVLSVNPQLAEHCTTYQKFNGYSRCMLIAKQPQFAKKFSLEELGDPKSACWKVCDKDDFKWVWAFLAEARPEFAKYRKDRKQVAKKNQRLKKG